MPLQLIARTSLCAVSGAASASPTDCSNLDVRTEFPRAPRGLSPATAAEADVAAHAPLGGRRHS